MQFSDYMAVIPSIIGLLMGILGSILAFFSPSTLARKLLWAGAFIALALIGIAVTIQNQREIARERVAGERTQKDQLGFAGGGDSYPVVMPSIVFPPSGPPQVGFFLTKQGNYPLYSVSVFVGRAYRVPGSPTVYAPALVSQQFNEISNNISYPLAFDALMVQPVIYYQVILFARNGRWEGVIEVRRTTSKDSWRMVLFGAVNQQSLPDKLIMDLSSPDFPESARRNIIYPIERNELPLKPAGTP